MPTINRIFFFTALLIFGGLAIWLISTKHERPLGSAPSQWIFAISQQESSSSPAAEPSPSGTPQSGTSLKKFAAKPGVETRYIDDGLGFSFNVPDGFTVGAAKTNVPGAEAVTAENNAGDKLLIIVRPISGSLPSLRVPDVQAISPGIAVEDSAPISVGKGIEGLAFDAADPQWNGADCAELWFSLGGYLFQVSAPRADANLLLFVWQSWKFPK